MATIRKNARYGTALLLCSTWGCVSTDEPLFDELVVPEPPTESVESTVAGNVSAAVASAEHEPVTEVLPLVPAQGMLSAPPAGSAPAPPESAPLPQPELPPAPELPAPCPPEGLLLCESFEQSASGVFPGEPWLRELPGCTTHRVASAPSESPVSHSGVNALAAVAGGYPECMLHAGLEQEPELYLRSWVRLGPEPALRQQYLTLLELGPGEDDDEPELRVGLRPAGGSLCGSDPGLDVSVSGLQGSGPSTECSGAALEPERWYCLQAHVKRDGRRLDYELALDGSPLLSISGLRLGPAWADELYFKVGRAAYGASATGTLWHDDVAVSRVPLPCAAVPP